MVERIHHGKLLKYLWSISDEVDIDLDNKVIDFAILSIKDNKIDEVKFIVDECTYFDEYNLNLLIKIAQECMHPDIVDYLISVRDE